MTLKILTEAGYTFGFGHFYRMSGVCDAISGSGHEVKMYVYADDVAKSNLTKDYIAFADWIDPDKIEEIVDSSDTVVVDSYHVDMEILDTVNKRAGNLIVIDDNIRLDYRDMIIVNPNYFAVFLEYPQDRGNSYFLGKDYTLLREPFNKVGRKETREAVSDVLITMGGTDLKQRTQKAIKILKDTDDDVKLHVVVTNAYRDIEDIRSLMGVNDRLYTDINAAEMCNLMQDCDFAIATAGGTSNELIKTQCPSILNVVADNQLLNARYMATEGYFDLMEEGREREITESFLNYDKRREMTDKLQSLYSEKSAVDLISETAYGEG